MAEHALATQTKDRNPDEVTGILPELVKDIGSAQTEFVASLTAILEDMTEEELAQLGVQRAEQESLQDRYRLPFNPEKTIPKLGDVAMIMTMPDIAKTAITRESVAVIDGEKDEQRIKREQEDKEFDDAIEAKRAHAESIIRRFLQNNANPSVLATSGVHPEWVDALTARGRARLDQYGTIENIPADELYGMINVCAIGLAKSERGIEFGNHN